MNTGADIAGSPSEDTAVVVLVSPLLIRTKLTDLLPRLDRSYFKEHSSFLITLFSNFSYSVSHARYYMMPVHSLRRTETLSLLM